MGLFVDFIFRSPVMVKLVGYHGLATLIDVNVPYSLLARLVQPGQSFNYRSGICLRFQSQPHVTFRCAEMLAHVGSRTSQKFGKNAVER